MTRLLLILLISCTSLISIAQKGGDPLTMAHRWWTAINPNYVDCNGAPNANDANISSFGAKTEICIKGWINNNYTAWATLNDSLVHLAALPDLQRISFANSPNDKLLGSLSKLSKLRILEANNGLSGASDITEKGLYTISRMKNMEVLRLNGCGIVGGNINVLKELPNLKELWLTGWPITDKSLSTISGLKNLRILRLNRTTISDAGLAMIEWPINLEELNLELTPVTGKSINSLSKIPNLKKLNISNTNIGDDSIDAIIKFIRSKKGLAELMIYGPQLTAANKKAIAEAAPKNLAVRY